MSINTDLEAMLKRDLDFAISQMPCALTRDTSKFPEWEDVSITGTRGEIETVPRIEDAGNFIDYDFLAIFRIADFTTEAVDVPDVRDTVTVDGTNYFIARKVPSQDGIDVTFGLARI